MVASSSPATMESSKNSSAVRPPVPGHPRQGRAAGDERAALSDDAQELPGTEGRRAKPAEHVAP